MNDECRIMKGEGNCLVPSGGMYPVVALPTERRTDGEVMNDECRVMKGEDYFAGDIDILAAPLPTRPLDSSPFPKFGGGKF